jgi:copper homeostasis protein
MTIMNDSPQMLHARGHAVIPESLVIEVCVDSIESAIACVHCFSLLEGKSSINSCVEYRAVKGGADRLELCANLANGGGTTPTLGLVRTVYNLVDVSLMVRETFRIF